MAFEKNPDEIGALWSKKSQKGMKFFAGYIELNGVKTDIVIFPRKKSDNDKAPSATILKSKPMDKGGQKPQPKAQSQDSDDIL